MHSINSLIPYFWFTSSIVLIAISIFGNTAGSRCLGATIFIMFGLIAGLRDADYNNDTKNYVMHFETYRDVEASQWFSAIFGSWFEPGYSLISFVSSAIMPTEMFILCITLAPTLMFAWSFLKFKYHPAVIAHVLSTIMLVGATTTVRHFIVLSVVFAILNLYVYRHKINTASLILPAILHYSAIPLVAILAYERARTFVQGRPFVLMATLTIASYVIYLSSDFSLLLIEKLSDRAEEETQSAGLRNFVLIVMLALTMHYKGKLRVTRLHLLHVFGIILSLSIVLTGLLGLNRLVSFFAVGFLVYFNFYNSRNRAPEFLNMFALNAVTLASTLYFGKDIF